MADIDKTPGTPGTPGTNKDKYTDVNAKMHVEMKAMKAEMQKIKKEYEDYYKLKTSTSSNELEKNYKETTIDTIMAEHNPKLFDRFAKMNKVEAKKFTIDTINSIARKDNSLLPKINNANYDILIGEYAKNFISGDETTIIDEYKKMEK